MSLITPKTTLESDLSEKDASVMRCAEAAHHLAVVMRNENARFWGIPTDRLLDILNHDVAVTLATFAANTALGQSLDAILDQIADQRFPTRAPVQPGRTDIVYQEGAFVLIDPPEAAENPPEPETL